MTAHHRVQPVRQGRRIVCRECGCDAVYVRRTKIIPRPHYRHMTYQQTPGHLALISPNWRP